MVSRNGSRSATDEIPARAMPCGGSTISGTSTTGSVQITASTTGRVGHCLGLNDSPKGCRYESTHPTTLAPTMGKLPKNCRIVYKLQSWGLPIQIADPELQASGQNFLRREIETEVAKAVEKIFQQARAGLGSGNHPESTRRTPIQLGRRRTANPT